MLQKHLMPMIKITFQNVNNKHYDTKIYKKGNNYDGTHTENIYIMIHS